MADTIRVAVLLGTVRSNRQSEKAATYIYDFGKSVDGVQIELVDPRNLNFSDEGEEVKDPAYSEVTAQADAFIIIAPEYNHSYPGTLKRMLDSEYANYKHKPVALVGVSNGGWGGTRVCEALLSVCHRLGLVNIQPELYFPMIQDIFAEDGTMKAEYAERYGKNTRQLFDELIWFARPLKPAR